MGSSNLHRIRAHAFYSRHLVRDVKPDNVVLDQNGFAKLTDFGMSRLGTSSQGKFSFAPGMPPGSPHYTAPEVITGEGYDWHADLYSFAILVWVLLTGGLSDVLPPCAEFGRGKGIAPLLGNWRLLRNCVENARAEGAMPVPLEDAKEFILRFTDRSNGPQYDRQGYDHKAIREHTLFQQLQMPPPGANYTTVIAWLDAICR